MNKKSEHEKFLEKYYKDEASLLEHLKTLVWVYPNQKEQHWSRYVTSSTNHYVELTVDSNDEHFEIIVYLPTPQWAPEMNYLNFYCQSSDFPDFLPNLTISEGYYAACTGLPLYLQPDCEDQ